MTIYFAADHAGFEMKNMLLAYVRDELGYPVEDCGPHTYDIEDDYPDIISIAARAVSEDSVNRRGIILGGSGQGEAIVANKFPGVRAAVYYGREPAIIKLSREHNDANILSLGARFLDNDAAKNTAKLWLETVFSGETRHARRIAKIQALP